MSTALAIGTMALAIVAQGAPFRPVDPAARQEAVKHYRAGEEQMHAEAWEAAVTEFRAAVRLDPLFDLAHYSLGQAYMALKRYSEAAGAYLACREAIRAKASLDQKEWAALERQRDDELRELRQTVRNVQSGQIKTPTPDAMVLRLEERIRVLEEGRMRGKQGRFEVPADVSLALGSAYLRQSLLSEAEAAYLDAVRVNGKLGAAHNNLAIVYLRTGRLKEAAEEIRLAERAGFRVSPRLKEDLAQAAAASPSKP